MLLYDYDVEVYHNFFSAYFIAEDGSEYIFTTFGEQNDFQKLRDFLISFGGDLILVGHNSLHYDDIILRAILEYPTVTTQALKRLSNKLIEGIKDFRRTDVYFALRYPDIKLWRSIDTMAITRVNKQRTALKFAAILLKHSKIQDLPLPPDSIIQPSQVEEMILYNRNDVIITKKFFNAILDLIQLRRDIGLVFDVDVETANDTEIGKAILNKIYVERTGIPYSTLKKMRTERHQIKIGDCMGKNINLVTPELIAVRDEIAGLTVYEYNRFKFKKRRIVFAGTTYDIGIGGLHSVDDPGIFETDDEYIIRDCDVASYYPKIAILNKFFPKHLGEEFLRVYEEIVIERLEAKAKGKLGDSLAEIKAFALKIAINSVFGLMNNEYYWLYDPKVLLSITVTGEFSLFDLIEKLSLENIQTISANTDGIVCKIRRDQEKAYYRICQEWEKRHGYELEYTDYKEYVRRDVNNYLTIKEDGKVKGKGIFMTELIRSTYFPKLPMNFGKGYDKPIISLALYEYFVNGIPVETTIMNHQDVHDFMIAKKSGKDFKIFFEYVNADRQLVCDEVQKTTRFIASITGGSLVKRDITGKQISMLAGHNATPLNDIESTDPADYPIAYQYYIDQALKIVETIEPITQNLFALT